MISKCLSCNEEYLSKNDKNLKRRFQSTVRFSNIDIKKIILLLENGVYPFEYMNEWDKFNETSLPEK